MSETSEIPPEDVQDQDILDWVSIFGAHGIESLDPEYRPALNRLVERGVVRRFEAFEVAAIRGEDNGKG